LPFHESVSALAHANTSTAVVFIISPLRASTPSLLLT
jgi:hypothetical protein